MTSARVTMMLVVPGRRTVSLELTPRWPAALIGVLLVPLLMGAAVRRCVDTLHASGQPLCRIAAHDVTGSLSALSSASVAGDAAPLHEVAALVAVAEEARPAHSTRFADAPALTAIAQRVMQPRAAYVSPALGPDSLSTTWLRVQALHLGESIRVHAFDAEGAADPLAFDALRHLMRCRITGREIEIDPKLVRLLAAIGAAYNRPIQLVSGHRQPHVIGTSSTSQHTLGKAADIRVAGVGVDELRTAALKLGARGIGAYPEKGFVHVDVRDKKYRWTYTQADGEVRDMN